MTTASDKDQALNGRLQMKLEDLQKPRLADVFQQAALVLSASRVGAGRRHVEDLEG